MAQDYVTRVRALLDRAEHPDTPQAERELAQSMAMRLMTRHQITDAMIGDRGETKDEIGQIRLSYTGIFGQAKREIVHAVARAMGARYVIYDNTWRKPKSFDSEVTGWKSDLERLEVLVASLQLQATTALREWEKEQKETGWNDLSRQEQYKDRRQFILSFAGALGRRLQTAFETAVREAATERAQETEESDREALAGVALALRDRKESVNDWYDVHYGNSLRTVHTRRAAGGYGASAAGRAAGSRADIGQTRVGGGRRAIGR